MKAAISGSRNFSDLKFLIESVEQVVKEFGPEKRISSIWAGGAKGADTLAKEAAEHLGLPFHEIKADWALYGRAAGPKRNAQLVEATDLLIAFPIGESKGTRGCMALAKKSGKPVFAFEPKL